MIVLQKVYGWARGARDLLLPPHCAYCEAATMGSLICDACACELPWNAPACPSCALPSTTGSPCSACLQRAPPFDSAYAAFRLEAPIQQSVHGLKYSARFLDADLLAATMAEALAARGEPLPTLLIPVPLHQRKLFKRGYNQSLELAHALGKRLRIPVDATAARQLHATPDQIGLSAAKRRRNLKGAFQVDALVAGLHIALLDDVMTTGATLSELARAAKAAGAMRVEAWAVARVPLR